MQQTNKHISHTSLCESSWYHSAIHACVEDCFWLKYQQVFSKKINNHFHPIKIMKTNLWIISLHPFSFIKQWNSDAMQTINMARAYSLHYVFKLAMYLHSLCNPIEKK